jgi:hypothetical protein
MHFIGKTPFLKLLEKQQILTGKFAQSSMRKASIRKSGSDTKTLFFEVFYYATKGSDRVIGNSISGHYPRRNEKWANFVTPCAQ